MDDVEHPFLVDLPLDRFPIDIEVILKDVADSIGVLGRQLHHDINVARHARHSVVVDGHGSRYHISDATGGQPLGYSFQNLQLFAHLRSATVRSLSRRTMLWPFIFLGSSSSAVRRGKPTPSARAT